MPEKIDPAKFGVTPAGEFTKNAGTTGSESNAPPPATSNPGLEQGRLVSDGHGIPSPSEGTLSTLAVGDVVTNPGAISRPPEPEPPVDPTRPIEKTKPEATRPKSTLAAAAAKLASQEEQPANKGSWLSRFQGKSRREAFRILMQDVAAKQECAVSPDQGAQAFMLGGIYTVTIADGTIHAPRLHAELLDHDLSRLAIHEETFEFSNLSSLERALNACVVELTRQAIAFENK